MITLFITEMFRQLLSFRFVPTGHLFHAESSLDLHFLFELSNPGIVLGHSQAHSRSDSVNF